MKFKKSARDFLKPTKINIILLVIIGLLAVLVGSNFLQYIFWSGLMVRMITFYPRLNSFFWFPLLSLTKDPLFKIFSQGRMGKLILPLLVNIVYWYFLSSIVAFTYSKFKKR